MDYRFYLFDTSGHIAAVEDMDTGNSSEAVGMAEALYEACSDIYSGFELWAGIERVTGRFGTPHPTVSAETLSERTQRSMVDHEEHMQAAFAAIARSRKLLERQNKLTRQRAAVPSNT